MEKQQKDRLRELRTDRDRLRKVIYGLREELKMKEKEIEELLSLADFRQIK